LYEATVGVSCITCRVASNGRQTTLNICDTAGQDTHRSMSLAHCRDAAAAIIVYDQTNESSAAAVPQWVEMFEDTVQVEHYVVVVANKDDASEKVVDSERMEYWSLERGYRFFRVSAKTGVDVKQMVERIVDDLSSFKKFQVAPPGMRLDDARPHRCNC
jgi:Ras-related protein Rab-5C